MVRLVILLALIAQTASASEVPLTVDKDPGENRFPVWPLEQLITPPDNGGGIEIQNQAHTSKNTLCTETCSSSRVLGYGIVFSWFGLAL